MSRSNSDDFPTRNKRLDGPIRLRNYYQLVWEDDEAAECSSPLSNTVSGGGPPGEEELATKMLQIQSKRFYLDVKQNWRGRFIKIAEVGAGGRKSRLLMSMSVAAEFRDHLSAFIDFYDQLAPATEGGAAAAEGGQLKSETMVRESRRYYLDLKENNRGRFLRVTQALLRGPRSLVVLPAQGMVLLRDALTDIIEEFGSESTAAAGAQNGTTGFQGELPESKRLRVENKMFFFDVGQNPRGVFLRIAEVKSNYRTSITIPERSWGRFRDILAEMCEQIEEQKTSGATARTSTSAAVAAEEGEEASESNKKEDNAAETTQESEKEAEEEEDGEK